MRKLRFTVALCASTLSFAALAVALISWGGNADEGEDKATVQQAAALQGYFAQMSEIDDMSDQQFEESVFGVEQESAKSYAAAFDAVLAMLEAKYKEVDPPSQVEKEHETLIAAVRDYRLGIDHGLRPLAFDAPASASPSRTRGSTKPPPMPSAFPPKPASTSTTWRATSAAPRKQGSRVSCTKTTSRSSPHNCRRSASPASVMAAPVRLWRAFRACSRVAFTVAS